MSIRENIFNLKFLSLLILLSFFTHVQAQWNPFVINYKKELYGKGAQTWDIAPYDESRIYFANNHGVVGFNGYEWSVIPLGNRAEVRSIAVSTTQELIYVGGESEFGYFEPGETGELIFHNLSTSFVEEYQLYGSYWGVYEVDNLVYFVSDKFIAKYIEGRGVPIYSNYKIDCSAIVKDVLYIGTTEGLRMVMGNSILPVPAAEQLNGKNIRAIAPYKDGFLIATAMDGLFYYHANELEPYVTGEEKFIKENEIFSMAVSGDKIALGTIYKGLLLMDESEGSRHFFNEYNGLQNNTILSLAFDKQNNIWAGLDNGLAYIPLDVPFTNLYTFPYTKGAGYSALIKDNTIWLGTNRGLFYTSYPVQFTDDPHNFQTVSGLIGQVWSLIAIEDDIFCLHDKGLYIVHPDKNVTQVSGIRGALTLIPDPKDPALLWVGCYDGLYMLRKINNEWKFIKQVDELYEWMKEVVIDKNGDFWLRVINYGFYRYTIDPEEGKVIKREAYPIPGSSYEGLYVKNVLDKTIFISSEGFFVFDSGENIFKPCEEFNQLFLPNQAYKALREHNGKLYALSENMIQVASFNEEGEYIQTKQYPFHPSWIGLISYYETIEIIDEHQVIIPNENGFSLLNPDEDVVNMANQLFMDKIFLTYPKDTVLYADNYKGFNEEYRIPFRNNALRFEFAVRSWLEENFIHYRYRLIPDTEWSEFVPSNIKEYSNLKEGRYQFEVEALYPDGSVSGMVFPFTVLPPWHRSTPAYIIYMVLIFSLLWGIYRGGEIYIGRKNRLQLAAKDKELEEKEQQFHEIKLRQEQRIIALKNEKLEQELKFKSQEMANLTINLSRKNEALLEIKQDLYKVINDMKGEALSRHKRLLLTISSSIDVAMQSDDLLKRFEEQFNLVHNNFMQKLSDKHPDLSLSERKMCAYLKMNLSSKEIAPLLNLSVRGVETLRYRLRKKMNLGREEGLTEYLNSIR